jgi:hypothetical protein
MQAVAGVLAPHARHQTVLPSKWAGPAIPLGRPPFHGHTSFSSRDPTLTAQHRKVDTPPAAREALRDRADLVISAIEWQVHANLTCDQIADCDGGHAGVDTRARCC